MLDSMLHVYEQATLVDAMNMEAVSEEVDAASADAASADALAADLPAGQHQLRNYAWVLSNYSSCPEQAFFNQRLLSHGKRHLQRGELREAQRAVRAGEHVMKDVHWSVPTKHGPARVTVLDHERWPRFMVTDARAYASWPPGVRDRVARVLSRAPKGSYINSDSHVRSAGPPPNMPIKEACLYHPFVPGNVTGTQGRGSQASYFSKDGFWYV